MCVDEFKSCPFCGDDNVSLAYANKDLYAGCNGCGARGPVLLESDKSVGAFVRFGWAAEQWNNRKQLEEMER